MDLGRFYPKHEVFYPLALRELKNGRKRTHWMWFLFPQIQGLGESDRSKKYAIADLEEARAFLQDPILGRNLRTLSGVLLDCRTNHAETVFGYVDAMKLRSSMTLFHLAGGDAAENRVFRDVLCKFFRGIPDVHTLQILGMELPPLREPSPDLPNIT